MLSNRQAELDKQYEDADRAKREAEEDRALWDEKIGTIKDETDEMIKKAQESAKDKQSGLVGVQMVR